MNLASDWTDEARIARATVDAMLYAGCSVDVRDEAGRTLLTHSTFKADILAVMGQSAFNTLRAYHKKQGYHGFVMLIWGNGHDVIGDYSDENDSPLFAHSIKSALDLAEQLAKGW